MAIYTDQFLTLDPYAPPPAGTLMTVSLLDLNDNNNDGDFDAYNNDSVGGLDITSSYPGDTVTLFVAGVGNITYTGVTFYLSDGSRVFTPNDGQVLQQGTLVTTSWVSGQGPLYVSQLGPTCFTPGTLIETTNGPQPIETLGEGTRVRTLDHGPQPLMWLIRTRHRALGNAAPVVIEPGALGNDRRLVVSQQHRLLMTGWRAELYLGSDEALVAAKHLVNGDTIRIVEGGTVDYLHLLLPRHEIVLANGIPTESFHPEHAAELGDTAQMARIHARFPMLFRGAAAARETARPVARWHEAGLIAA